MSRRILIFSLAYHPVVGGAEIAVKEITDRVADVEFDLVTLNLGNHSRRERIGNVNVYRIGGGLGYLSKMFFVPRAAFWALGKKYDAYWAIMTYMLFPVVVGRILGNRTPYVLTLQDGDPFERVFKRWYILPFVPLLRYGFSHASRVQTISNYLAQWPRQFGYKEKVEVIPNGVDIRKFKDPNPKPETRKNITLITTSRLVEKNAVGDIIESLEYLPENYSLQILGVGSLETELRSKAKRYGPRVEFLGHIEQKDVPKHLHAADVFVRPSLSEGFGSSFVEAMAAGVPVVATPVGGITDFLENEETGLFCEVKNPKSIAEQVKRLMDDGALKYKIVANAEKMVEEKYDWNHIAHKMGDLLKSV